MKQLEHPGVVAALLVLAVAVVLSGCWNAPFDRGDDEIAVLWAAEHSPAELLKPKQYPVFPITLLSLKLDYAFFGAPASVPPRAALADPAHARLWSAGARVMNGIYAVIAGLALWYFLRRIGSGPELAAAVAFAWIVHPMSCESICWIVERKNVLAALFGFFALAVWIEEGLGFWRWPLVYVLYALAIFSKPSALGLLPVFAAIEFFKPHVFESPVRREKEWLLSIERMIGPALISVLGMMYSTYALRHDVVPPPGGSAWTALLTDVSIFGQYIQHILAPLNLSFYYYVEPIVSLFDARLWSFGLPMAAFLVALAWLSGTQRRLAIFGIIWFFGALGPNSNIVSSAFPMQDRFTFLGAPGLLLAIFLAAKNVLQRWFKAPSVAYAPIAAYMLFLAILTIRLSPMYRDDSELKITAAESQPRSAFAQLGAGGAYYQRTLQYALAIAPNVREVQENARAALLHYEAAQQCPDYLYFDNPLTIRVYKADLYRILGGYSQARALLKGWLPPEHQTMLADNTDHFKNEFHTGYVRGALADAWAMACKIALQEAAQTPLSNESCIELCREALHAADESAKLRADDNTTILKARVLLALSIFETPIKARRENYNAAAELLRSLEQSALAPLAKKLLSSVTRP